MKLKPNINELEEKESQKISRLVKPIIVAPAMNTMMWEHPITEEQLNRLRNWGYTIIDPI
jgi:phosphopantothenoylcysteine synthetase/decarboxylase